MGLVEMEKNLVLDVPIIVDGAEVREVTIRRPKVRDQMMNHTGGEMTPEGTGHMMANLMGLKYDDVLEMDLGDYLRAQEVYNAFLPQGARPSPPVTSGESSP